jgi:hypothetical protein
MVNITSCHNYHIVTKVVGLMEVNNHITIDLVDVIDIT